MYLKRSLIKIVIYKLYEEIQYVLWDYRVYSIFWHRFFFLYIKQKMEDFMLQSFNWLFQIYILQVLGNKERFDKEQIGIKEPFPVTNLSFTS